VEQIINDVLISVIFNLKMKHGSCGKKRKLYPVNLKGPCVKNRMETDAEYESKKLTTEAWV
jgi:hypothetical protein